MHLAPAGLPFGMPGMGLLMEGAIQHAPQPLLHSIAVFKVLTKGIPRRSLIV